MFCTTELIWLNQSITGFFKQEKNIEDSVFSVNLVVAKFTLS